jgi:hypothetical protein
MRAWVLLVVIAAACSGEITGAGGSGSADAPIAADAPTPVLDARSAPPDGAPDAAPDARVQPECEWGGAPGTCITAAACNAMTDRTPETGCSGGLFCCIDTPDLTDNPPFPTGYRLMMQSEVTQEMTDWAVMILHDHVTYPMYATTTMMFGSLLVLAQVEWHPPDFQNHIIHRGVTLFVPK